MQRELINKIIADMENNALVDTNTYPVGNPKYNIKMTITRKTVIFTNIPDNGYVENIVPDQNILHSADLVISIKTNGKTYISKNRFGIPKLIL